MTKKMVAVVVASTEMTMLMTITTRMTTNCWKKKWMKRKKI